MRKISLWAMMIGLVWTPGLRGEPSGEKPWVMGVSVSDAAASKSQAPQNQVTSAGFLPQGTVYGKVGGSLWYGMKALTGRRQIKANLSELEKELQNLRKVRASRTYDLAPSEMAFRKESARLAEKRALRSKLRKTRLLGTVALVYAASTLVGMTYEHQVQGHSTSAFPEIFMATDVAKKVVGSPSYDTSQIQIPESISQKGSQ